MSTGLAVFDETIQLSNGWLKALEPELGLCSREQAYRALRAVLHVLRDRLPETAVLGLSAQMPLLLRGVLLEGWRPQAGLSGLDDVEAFVGAVEDRLGVSFPCDARTMAVAVFAIMTERLDPGEVDKLIRYLPAALHVLWPEDYRIV